MRIAVPATVVASVMLLGIAPPPPPPQTRQCDVALTVSDLDPAGLQVRGDPSATAPTLTTLTSGGKRIAVHITGQQADWYRIDRAVAGADETTAGGERVLFEGAGWVHGDKLAAVALKRGARVYGDLDKPPVWVLPPDGAIQAFKVIGCVDENLLIEIDGRAGFTRDHCANRHQSCG